MNDDELNPRDGEGTDDNGISSDGRRPNGGSGTAGPKKPGKPTGGTGQYSVGDNEGESTEGTSDDDETQEPTDE